MPFVAPTSLNASPLARTLAAFVVLVVAKRVAF